MYISNIVTYIGVYFTHHFIWFIKQDSQDKNTSFVTFIKNNMENYSNFLYKSETYTPKLSSELAELTISWIF